MSKGSKLLIDLPGRWAFTHQLNPAIETRVGRADDCELKLDNAKVSFRHAIIAETGGAWVVRDLASRNGTFVNERRVTEAILRDQDILKIAGVVTVFRNDAKETSGAGTNWRDLCSEIAKEDRVHRRASGSAIGERSHISLPEVMIINANEEITGFARDDQKALVPIHFDVQTEEEKAAQDDAWVELRFNDMLEQIEARGNDPADVIYDLVIEYLRKTLKAQNAFVMIANRDTGRWEIRAWAGNTGEWNSFAKEHPLSFTVANQAFTSGKIICNSIEGVSAADPSRSLQELGVTAYLASPVHFDAESLGVLYFDSRHAGAAFRTRDLMLLESAATVVARIAMAGAKTV
ncbi:hypothetical protein BH09SUM1_BH09SUM1_17170 [soil metagenome]